MDKNLKSESGIMEKKAPDKIQVLMIIGFFTYLGILVVADLTKRASQRKEN